MKIRTDNMNRELKKGEFQRKDGTYMFRYTDPQGNRKSVYDSNLNTLRDKEERILLDMENGMGSGKDMTLNEQFARYMSLKTHISNTTKVNQRCLWENHVKETLGEQNLRNIRKSDILVLYSTLSQEKGLKNSSIQRVHHLLHPCFELAVDDDLIRKNPCKGCLKGYPNDTKEKRALTGSEQQIFLEYVKNSYVYSKYYPLFAFMLETGLRRGEVFGLTWQDVNLPHKTISINHQLQYGSEGGQMHFYIDTPKSDAGIRLIPLTSYATEMLCLQKDYQINECRQTETSIDGYTGFVFSTKNHTPYIPANINAVLAGVVSSYNDTHLNRKLPHITAHILRHTACTRMAEAGMDPKVLQYIMGHSSISVTMNVYNHVSDDRNRKEINKLDRKRRSSREQDA